MIFTYPAEQYITHKKPESIMLGKETMNIEEFLAATEQMLHVIWRVLFALPKAFPACFTGFFILGIIHSCPGPDLGVTVKLSGIQRQL